MNQGTNIFWITENMHIYVVRKITTKSIKNDRLYLPKIDKQYLLTAYCQTLQYQGYKGRCRMSGSDLKADW